MFVGKMKSFKVSLKIVPESINAGFLFNLFVILATLPCLSVPSASLQLCIWLICNRLEKLVRLHLLCEAVLGLPGLVRVLVLCGPSPDPTRHLPWDVLSIFCVSVSSLIMRMEQKCLIRIHRLRKRTNWTDSTLILRRTHVHDVLPFQSSTDSLKKT